MASFSDDTIPRNDFPVIYTPAYQIARRQDGLPEGCSVPDIKVGNSRVRPWDGSFACSCGSAFSEVISPASDIPCHGGFGGESLATARPLSLTIDVAPRGRAYWFANRLFLLTSESINPKFVSCIPRYRLTITALLLTYHSTYSGRNFYNNGPCYYNSQFSSHMHN